MHIKSYHVIIAVIVAVAAVGALIICFFVSADSREIEKALIPKSYDTVCIKSEMKTDYLNNNNNNQDINDKTSNSDGYYIDENGNLIQPGDDGYPAQLDNEERFETIVTMIRSGGIVYENGISGEYYFFKENERDFVLFLDKMEGLNDEGVWTKLPLANFNLKPLFDPDCLFELSKKDFVRKKKGYVPVSGRLDEVFHTLLGTSVENRDKYIIFDLILTTENNKISTVTAIYELSAEVRITQKWSFSFESIRLALPEVQKKYKESEVDS
mgnify:FL=1